MREKKNYTVITFATTTAAMAMESRCSAGSIPGRLIPVPTSITAGCGLAWRMTVEAYCEYREKLESMDLNYEQIVELML